MKLIKLVFFPFFWKNMKNSELCVLHFWKNIMMFFVFFPKRLTHILSKLILIFFPFLCLPFLFFMYLLGIQTQKILIHKPKKFSHTQKKTFKPVPLPSKSQTFLSLPKLSQLFLTPLPASLLISTVAATKTDGGSSPHHL